MSEDEKCNCGMPLNDFNRCKCQPTKCYYCCSCGPDCTCGCQDKKRQDDAKE